jgi:hypothetical protein
MPELLWCALSGLLAGALVSAPVWWAEIDAASRSSSGWHARPGGDWRTTPERFALDTRLMLVYFIAGTVV